MWREGVQNHPTTQSRYSRASVWGFNGEAEALAQLHAATDLALLIPKPGSAETTTNNPIGLSAILAAVEAPKQRTTQSGIPVTNGKVAVGRAYTSGGEKKVSYFDLTAWGAQAKTLAAKTWGTSIFFWGALENDGFEAKGGGKRYVTCINVSTLFPPRRN